MCIFIIFITRLLPVLSVPYPPLKLILHTRIRNLFSSLPTHVTISCLFFTWVSLVLTMKLDHVELLLNTNSPIHSLLSSNCSAIALLQLVLTVFHPPLTSILLLPITQCALTLFKHCLMISNHLWIGLFSVISFLKTDFKISTINCCNILNKMSAFLSFISLLDPEIVLATESWLHDSVFDREISITSS